MSLLARLVEVRLVVRTSGMFDGVFRGLDLARIGHSQW
jgi:hypothetical protein